ncbi:hypothetical protein ABT340_04645 [Streptosporangium sp. NPDC000239]|uniref:hypothetical protein n=1 Tax=Streptosporangium sp. NPDC000239 TaxID=3154248 RepID=UPI00332911A7
MTDLTIQERAARAAAEAEMLAACAEQSELLAAAKAAYEENPCPETLAARRDAMGRMYEFRAFFRTIARIQTLRSEAAKHPADSPKRQAAEAEAAVLCRAVGQAPDWTPPSPTPSGGGDVTVAARPVRGRGQAMRPGGA